MFGRFVIALVLAVLVVVVVLLPTYVFFRDATSLVRKAGMFQDVVGWLWQGFAIMVFVVVALVLLLFIEILLHM